MNARYGGIEAGGSKFVCVVGAGPAQIVARERISTTTPAETLARVVAFFVGAAEAHGSLSAFGVASFGPLDLDPQSPAYGEITHTPKDGWSGVDLVGALRVPFGVPVALATDVHGAALGEWLWGAARGRRTMAYVTVGTGIGGAVLRDGEPLDAIRHPELGHVRVPRHPDDRTFPGVCPFHRDCLEGLANGPSIVARWGRPLSELPATHPAWELESFYVAQLCATLALVVTPETIVIGGGVASAGDLLGRTRVALERTLAGYPSRLSPAALDDFVRAPALGELSGALGALALAQRAAGMSA